MLNNTTLKVNKNNNMNSNMVNSNDPKIVARCKRYETLIKNHQERIQYSQARIKAISLQLTKTDDVKNLQRLQTWANSHTLRINYSTKRIGVLSNYLSVNSFVSEIIEKRGRGRPKGSLNQSTVIRRQTQPIVVKIKAPKPQARIASDAITRTATPAEIQKKIKQVKMKNMKVLAQYAPDMCLIPELTADEWTNSYGKLTMDIVLSKYSALIIGEINKMIRATIISENDARDAFHDAITYIYTRLDDYNSKLGAQSNWITIKLRGFRTDKTRLHKKGRNITEMSDYENYTDESSDDDNGVAEETSVAFSETPNTEKRIVLTDTLVEAFAIARANEIIDVEPEAVTIEYVQALPIRNRRALQAIIRELEMKYLSDDDSEYLPEER